MKKACLAIALVIILSLSFVGCGDDEPSASSIGIIGSSDADEDSSESTFKVKESNLSEISPEDFERSVNEHFLQEIESLGTPPQEKIPCTSCYEGKVQCWVCEGNGYTVKQMPSLAADSTLNFYEQNIPCFTCNETGATDCPECYGSGEKNNPDFQAYVQTCENIKLEHLAVLNEYYAKINSANYVNPVPPVNGGGGIIAPAPIFEQPVGEERLCDMCQGAGKVECSVCYGAGYLTTTEYGPDFGSGSTSYEKRTDCGCDGGFVPCRYCGADGTI